MKYRKKPVEIEAVKLEASEKSIREVLIFTGETVTTDCDIARDWFESYCKERIKKGGLMITTLEGEHIASFGDMVIKGVQGEFYPCKPDIFSMTYDAC